MASFKKSPFLFFIHFKHGEHRCEGLNTSSYRLKTSLTPFTPFVSFRSPSWRQKLCRTAQGIPTFAEDVEVSRGDGVAARRRRSRGGHAVAAVGVRGGAADAAAFHGRSVRCLVRFGWPRWRDVWNSLQFGSLRQRSLWESSWDLISTSGRGGNVIANGDVPHLRV